MSLTKHHAFGPVQSIALVIDYSLREPKTRNRQKFLPYLSPPNKKLICPNIPSPLIDKDGGMFHKYSIIHFSLLLPGMTSVVWAVREDQR